MSPRLLLALALLGMASSRRSAPPGVPAALEGSKFRYAVVTSLRTYAGAQGHCRKVLQGELASVHSAALNKDLMELARTYTRRKVWIGAVTRRTGGQWGSHWEDSSSWNYANWAPTNPSHLVPTCATLSTYDGLWRSRVCYELRPFICQY